MAYTDDLLERMKSTPSYKPSYANTFGDFSLDPGDILKIQTDSGEELLPVFSQQMSWNGSARTTLSASGNKSREVLPKQERDEYSYRQTIGGQMRGFGQKQKAMEDRLSYAEINIDEDKAQIQLITGRVDEAEGRISAAEITLNGADGQIGLVGRVETAEGDIKSAEVKIDGLNSEIELKADSSVTDALGKRVSSAEVKIDGLNSSISLKADATVTDALGERVSSAEVKIDGLNSEIKLKADKITLDGYVTANQMKTEFSNFESGISDNLYVRALSASNFECSHLTVNGSGLSLVQKTVVTGVSRTKRYAKAPSGTSNIEFYECSGVSTEKMYYVSWE